MMFKNIPSEIVIEILEYLEFHDIMKISCVNKNTSNIVSKIFIQNCVSRGTDNSRVVALTLTDPITLNLEDLTSLEMLRLIFNSSCIRPAFVISRASFPSSLKKIILIDTACIGHSVDYKIGNITCNNFKIIIGNEVQVLTLSNGVNIHAGMESSYSSMGTGFIKSVIRRYLKISLMFIILELLLVICAIPILLITVISLTFSIIMISCLTLISLTLSMIAIRNV